MSVCGYVSLIQKLAKILKALLPLKGCNLWVTTYTLLRHKNAIVAGTHFLHKLSWQSHTQDLRSLLCTCACFGNTYSNNPVNPPHAPVHSLLHIWRQRPFSLSIIGSEANNDSPLGPFRNDVNQHGWAGELAKRWSWMTQGVSQRWQMMLMGVEGSIQML